MGCDNGPSHGAIVAEAMQYKEQSLTDPNGVRYMDHLWGQVWNQSQDLTVVLRTDTEQFEGVDVRAWWSHGLYDFDSSDHSERSNLVFEVPDEVTRRIQSKHAEMAMRRFFGQHVAVDLPEPFLAHYSDETRDAGHGYGEGTTRQIIHNDWPTLKTAIEMTARDGGRSLGGQSIDLVSTEGRNGYALARVRNRNLELYIQPHTTQRLEAIWARAFKQEVLLDQSGRH